MKFYDGSDDFTKSQLHGYILHTHVYLCVCPILSSSPHLCKLINSVQMEVTLKRKESQTSCTHQIHNYNYYFVFNG